MIKQISNDGWTNISCDSCSIIIGDCKHFMFKEGQKLVYAPLLCESCGQKHNKDVGDDVFRLEKMEKLLTDFHPMLKNLGWANVLDEYMNKHGVSFDNFKYVNEKGETMNND